MKTRNKVIIGSLVILLMVFSKVICAENLESSTHRGTAVLFIPGIHHIYTGDAGLFRWSGDWKDRGLGSEKVNKEFAWSNVLTQAEGMGLDTYILFQKGKSKGEFVDGGVLGHKINEGMIKDSINELISGGYNKIVIMGHSQAGSNIFSALKTISEEDATKLNYIHSVRLFDPAFASPLGNLATKPVIGSVAKIVTGRIGVPLTPSEEDLTENNDYLNSIRRTMPDVGKALSRHGIPVYLMYANSRFGIVSQKEIKIAAEVLAKNGCKTHLFSPQTGSMKFGDPKKGNIGYLYKKDAPNPFNSKQQVPTESRLAHTPRLGTSENKIATSFYLYGLSQPAQDKKLPTDHSALDRKDLHGVYIDPQIVESVSVEKGVILITLKEEVLSLRPSKDSLSWPVKLPEEIE